MPIEEPESEALVPLDALRRSRKWTHFPARTTLRTRTSRPLAIFLSSSAGLATGSNGFFILSDEEIKDWHIPRRFLKPILPGPRYLTTDIIDATARRSPRRVSPALLA